MPTPNGVPRLPTLPPGQLQMWGFPLPPWTQQCTLFTGTGYKGYTSVTAKRKWGTGHGTEGGGRRTSMPSQGCHPTNTRVCSPTQQLSRTCFEVSLWRFHYIGKTDWITGHGDWAQSLMPLPFQNVGGEAENFNPLIVWLVFLATCPHPETIYLGTPLSTPPPPPTKELSH